MLTSDEVSRINEIKDRLNEASPYPWERGNHWHIQGETYCPCKPEWGPPNRARIRINGEMMWAHRHRLPDDQVRWKYGISTRDLQKGGHPWSVVVETTEDGTLADSDAEFIINSPEDVSFLLQLVLKLAGGK